MLRANFILSSLNSILCAEENNPISKLCVEENKPCQEFWLLILTVIVDIAPKPNTMVYEGVQYQCKVPKGASQEPQIYQLK